MFASSSKLLFEWVAMIQLYGIFFPNTLPFLTRCQEMCSCSLAIWAGVFLGWMLQDCAAQLAEQSCIKWGAPSSLPV